MIKKLRVKFILLIILPGFLAVSGCGNNAGGKSEEIIKPAVYKSNYNLKLLKSCDETEKFLKDAAKANIKRFFIDYSTGGSDLPIYYTDESSGDNAGEPEHSETNVQERGVDEADIVKNDGNYIYLLNDKYFLIFKSWPANELEELSRITFEGHPAELFLSNNRVIIFTNIYAYETPELFNGVPSGSILKISIYNVTDRANPGIERETYIEGWYMTSRRIGSKVHVMSRYYMDNFSPYNLMNKPELSGLGYDNPYLEAAMLAYIDNADLDEFLPKISDKIYSGSSTKENTLTFCDNTYVPETPNGGSIVSLFTFDLSDTDSDIKCASIVTNEGDVYSSLNNLYLACKNYQYWYWYTWDTEDGWKELTYIYKFSLEDAPELTAAGEVDGYMVNSIPQFAMSEYNDHLRIATTSNAWTWDGSSSNNIYIVKDNNGLLAITGKIEGIAPGETIYGVRFINNRGFIITFKQTDPLYTIDLSDPENPQLKGSLEMPGFSTYLHPLGEDHLIGIGHNADSSGLIDGLQLAVYDVSDMSNPVRDAQIVIGSGWDTTSDALYEHKAFQFYEPLGILSIPVHHWSWGADNNEFFNGAMLFKIDTASITSYGEIDHNDFYSPAEKGYWNWERQVKRSIFIGTESDGYFIYTISGVGIKVNDIDDLTAVLPGAELPNTWEDYWCNYIVMD